MEVCGCLCDFYTRAIFPPGFYSVHVSAWVRHNVLLSANKRLHVLTTGRQGVMAVMMTTGTILSRRGKSVSMMTMMVAVMSTVTIPMMVLPMMVMALPMTTVTVMVMMTQTTAMVMFILMMMS